jgi:peptide chain release factor 1
VLERLSGLENEYELVVMRLSDPAVQADQTKLREVGRRLKELEPIVDKIRERSATQGDLDTAREMANESDGADRDLMRAEADQLESRLAEIDEELKVLLLPRDPNNDRNVIVEIRGAEGGEEANLWARDLFEMYTRFCSAKGWRVQLLGSDPSSMGGLNEVSFSVAGDGVWTHMKHEGGPHRVQRVPATESQGRVHTSAATVTVLPEADEVDVDIKESDLRVDTYRSSSAGGQSVNTTDSAVRITHLPTGVVVAMQDERSQIQNRAKALLVLRSRLLQLEQERHDAEQSGLRKSQVGGGGRGEKIRTYNYKENRVTDHRIGLTIYKLDRVLMGELDEVVDALIADERARQLATANL